MVRRKGIWSMRMRVIGIVKEKESGGPLSGLFVRAFDKDIMHHDFLGEAVTGADGKFTIEYESKDFQELVDRNPDIYVEVHGKPRVEGKKNKRTRPIYTTRKSVRHNASSSEKFYIEISRKDL